MKSLFLLGTLFAGLFTWQAQAGQLCQPTTTHVEFCRNMKHMGTAINAVESQSVLMRIDPTYLGALAVEIYETAVAADKAFPAEFAKHKQYIDEVKKVALDLKTQSDTRDLNMLGTAHQIGRQCLNCHMALPTEEGSTSWNQMFGNSWKTINNECHQRGKNPYLCKTMNAISTNYNHIVTAYAAKKTNLNTIAVVSGEILRLLRDLGINRFDHMGIENRLQAEQNVMSVIEMAKLQDSRTLEKARDLNKTCMACHDRVAGVGITSLPERIVWQ